MCAIFTNLRKTKSKCVQNVHNFVTGKTSLLVFLRTNEADGSGKAPIGRCDKSNVGRARRRETNKKEQAEKKSSQTTDKEVFRF